MSTFKDNNHSNGDKQKRQQQHKKQHFISPFTVLKSKEIKNKKERKFKTLTKIFLNQKKFYPTFYLFLQMSKLIVLK